MDNSPPPWDAYRAIVVYRLVALDKRPGVHPVRIRETLFQARMACRSLQLCAGLEAGIEEAMHAVAQRQRDRNVPVPEGGEDEDSADDRTVAEGVEDSIRDEGVVGGVG